MPDDIKQLHLEQIYNMIRNVTTERITLRSTACETAKNHPRHEVKHGRLKSQPAGRKLDIRTPKNPKTLNKSGSPSKLVV